MASVVAEKFEAMIKKNSDRQMLWKSFLSKNQIKHAPDTLSKIAEFIEGFLSQPVEAIVQQRKFILRWRPPGPWA